VDALINTADDRSVSYKNLVNFGTVTPTFSGTFASGRLHAGLWHASSFNDSHLRSSSCFAFRRLDLNSDSESTQASSKIPIFFMLKAFFSKFSRAHTPVFVEILVHYLVQ